MTNEPIPSSAECDSEAAERQLLEGTCPWCGTDRKAEKDESALAWRLGTCRNEDCMEHAVIDMREKCDSLASIMRSYRDALSEVLKVL